MELMKTIMSLYNENYVLYDFIYVLCDTQERERSNSSEGGSAQTGHFNPRSIAAHARERWGTGEN